VERVILSPHIDDAILSLGGSIINWLDQGDNIRVANIFSVTASPFFWRRQGSSNAVIDTQTRKLEEREVAKELGEIFEYLDYPSSGCRGLKYLRPWIPATLQTRLPRDRRVFAAIAKTIEELFLSAPRGSFYAPIAPPPVAHADHVLVREAVLHTARRLLNPIDLFFYEELPYCARTDSFIRPLEQNGLTPIVNQISFERKRIYVMKYKSQIKEIWLQDMLSYCSKIMGERVWRVNSLPEGHLLR
jgi:LmbE family N-acetylglucosaminyl deacetylase